MALKPSAVVATKCDVKPEETLLKVDASLHGKWKMDPRCPAFFCHVENKVLYPACFQRKPNDKFFRFVLFDAEEGEFEFG